MRPRASMLRGALLVLLLCAAGCKHDLDKLRRASDDGLRDGGRGGDSGASGREAPPDAGGESGSDGGRVPVSDACEPCPEPSEQATRLGLRSCCRGLAEAECGLTFGGGNVCLPRDIPGQTDAACSGTTANGMRLEGCCRPDGRCGLLADATGLGCVAREQVLPGAGDESVEPIACRYECDADEDCNLLSGGFVCAEHPLDGVRFCADECLRDQDCPEDLGLVCAFANDFGMDRVLAICRPAVGSVEPGEQCSRAEDCVHGVCLRVASGDPYCSQLCRSGVDCPADQRMCSGSNISRPSATGDALRFTICRK
jgi:hypothetical protein